MAGVLFVCEGAVARRCRCHRTRACVFVCCAFYCCCCCCCRCCCCCSCTRVFVVWLVWMCKVGSVLVQVPNRYRFVYSSRNSEVARAQITFLPFSTGTHVIWAGYFCSCSKPGWSDRLDCCLLYTSPSPRDQRGSRMPSSA